MDSVQNSVRAIDVFRLSQFFYNVIAFLQI